MRKCLGTLAFAAALLCVRPVRAADQLYERSTPARKRRHGQLENVNGSIDLRGWDREAVEIHAVKTTRRDVSDLDRVTVEVRTLPNRVEILTHYPKDQGVDVSVDYEVHVPERVILEHIITVNGSIKMAGVEARGELRTVNGNIEAYNCAGSISAHTTNGNLREELSKIGSSEMELDTVNGSVILAVPPDASAELDARSMNGEVRSSLPVTVASAFTAGAFRGKLGAGGPLLDIRTVNGAIELDTLKGTI